MPSPQRIAIWILNVAIVIVAIFVARGVVRTYLLNPSNNSALASVEYLSAGAKFPLVDIDWSRKNETIILILQKGCGACEESAPFYQALKNALAKRQDVDLIAVMPDWLTAPESYLNRIGISVNSVKRSSLPALTRFGLQGTPTLVVVNRSGLISGLWFGKLNRKQQSEVLRLLNLDDKILPPEAEEADLEIIDDNGLQRLIDAGQKFVLLDVRKRGDYARAPLTNAKNIPLDELQVRAVNELSKSDLVVVYGGAEANGQNAAANTILRNEGFTRVVALKKVPAVSASGI